MSTTKLVVMSVFSFGLYQLYWFYKNWQLIAQHERRGYAVMMRSLLSVFYCYRLFEKVRAAGLATGARGYPAGWLATLYIVTSVFWLFPDAWLIIANAGVLCLLPVQAAANRVNEVSAPEHDRNGRFTGWNILTILLGMALQAASLAYWKLMLSL